MRIVKNTPQHGRNDHSQPTDLKKKFYHIYEYEPLSSDNFSLFDNYLITITPLIMSLFEKKIKVILY